MTKAQLYELARQMDIVELIEAAAGFERKECETICKSFAMKERRVEVAAALNRAADMIRLRSADDTPMGLPPYNTPVDFITYVD